MPEKHKQSIIEHLERYIRPLGGFYGTIVRGANQGIIWK